MKTGNPFQIFDLFDEPISVQSSMRDKLLSIADDFFDEFEDGLYVQIVGSRDKEISVHFHIRSEVPSVDKSRVSMYQGFIYGYFKSVGGVEWQ